jgi:glutamyl-tRNA synthetase
MREQFNMKLTKGNAIVAFEKLWFLQKAHAQSYAASGGPRFEAMVKQVSEAVERACSLEQLCVPPKFRL